MNTFFVCAVTSAAILFSPLDRSPLLAADSAPDVTQTASEVDRLLNQKFSEDGITPISTVRDEDFLRRARLDLLGTLSPPSDVTTFVLSPSEKKRSELIEKLLGDPAFGELWANYWTDVIFMRATEQRSQLGRPIFQQWMAAQLNNNRSWGEITHELLTASGDVRKSGQTALFFAHASVPEEIASEVPRIFLGIQLNCANCHDHPTDPWKREQFHELAAYFTRTTFRIDNSGTERTFNIGSLNATAARLGNRPEPRVLLFRLDRNRDGAISKQEARGQIANRFDDLLTTFDKNKDRKLNTEELTAALAQAVMQPGRGNAEHYMPDLKNPSSKGTLIEPAFFVEEAEGPALQHGMDDLARRNAASKYITSKSNPWFAKAFVNRIWSELLGQGFTMPIDDMGETKETIHPEVLALLASQFTESNYDIKWLFRTIMNTQAYQRQLAPAGSNLNEHPFAAATPTRLRGDQIYLSLQSAVGNFGATGRFMQRRENMAALLPAANYRQKTAFTGIFGFDPSTPQDELAGSIPQALYLMNSPSLNARIQAEGRTNLGILLRNTRDNKAALDELYLTTLTRHPSPEEQKINLSYIKATGDRNEAFEDILWALLNSTEFLSKR
ncbi:DUF1549 domain-containing protein [Planctomicrobium sp. SH527]|uniref:DUF1549 domain-containing protein n=1 Tax=Planctomicrobium sp. SH527 TaxID=3448123 RepID=UPI003F5B1726